MKKIDFKSLRKKIKSYKFDSFLFLYIFLPLLLNLVITCMELKSLHKGIVFMFTSPYIFIANALIILLTTSITLLLKRRVFWVSVISCIWLIFGIANFVLLCNRVTPFTSCDLFLIESLFDVLHKYFNWFQIILLGLLAAAACIGLVIMFFRAPKVTQKIPYIRNLVIIAVIAGLTVGSVQLGVQLGIMDGQFAELSAAFRKNGFVYCFTNSLIDTGVSRPKDYSPESMAEIIAQDDSHIDGDTAEKTPNIVIVQLESFFDITQLKGLEFSSDVIPNFHKYQSESGGLLSVPVVGAGTVNSEFEVLTGMTIDDFGAGEYPFKTILLNTTCESLAYNLKTYGYTAHALHNNTGRFYGRHIVYSHLGFDDFTSIEFMQGYDRTPAGWAKDDVLTGYIMDCLNKTQNQDFVYTISVQGHGGYSIEEEYEKHVTITACPENKEDLRNQMEYYANMIYEMDQFVQDLINNLNTLNEDTILVMYGDHLPSLDIENEDLEGRDMYQTDYFIWNNMGLDFGKKDLSANQLSSYVLKKLGMSNGIINAFHQNHSGDYDFDESLTALEYDILYGDQLVYGGENPYEATDMQFSLNPVEVYNVIPDETVENAYIIRGKNFTPYSKAYLNGEKKTTEFIDDKTIRMVLGTDARIEPGDIINVWQSQLSGTEDYTYNIIPMIKQKASEEDTSSPETSETHNN